MAKVAIIIGHNVKSQGAVRKDTGESEYKFNGRIAEMMLARSGGLDFKIFRRKSGGGYAAEIDRVYGEVDAWGADLSMELHFNAASSANASGCETLSSGTPKSKDFAKIINDSVVSALGVKDRGLVFRGKSDRGGRSLFAGKSPAILTEPFFGSSASDLRKVAGEKNEKSLAWAYVEGCMAALNITAPPVRPDAPITPPKTPEPSGLWAMFLKLFGVK